MKLFIHACLCMHTNNKQIKIRSTWIGRASMSALIATNGGPPVPIQARIPVLANGYLYPIPILSNSSLTNWLVLTSSKASSGFSWIFLLTLLNQLTVSGRRATASTASEQALVHTSHTVDGFPEVDVDWFFCDRFKVLGLKELVVIVSRNE